MQGPNAQSPAYVYPDVLLKEKEKLSKELERAKILYEAEVTFGLSHPLSYACHIP